MGLHSGPYGESQLADRAQSLAYSCCLQAVFWGMLGVYTGELVSRVSRFSVCRSAGLWR
jgi:hypothetical protein